MNNTCWGRCVNLTPPPPPQPQNGAKYPPTPIPKYGKTPPNPKIWENIPPPQPQKLENMEKLKKLENIEKQSKKRRSQNHARNDRGEILSIFHTGRHRIRQLSENPIFGFNSGLLSNLCASRRRTLRGLFFTKKSVLKMGNSVFPEI